MKLSYPLNLPFQISQRFGENAVYYSQFHDINGNPYLGHNGLDFAVPIGTPVYATHDGIVQFAQIDDVMSLTVSIDSSDGTFRTLHCHLSESKVSLGQSVKRGDLIALSGNTGRFTSGPHLHWGVHPLNPEVLGNGYNGAVNPFNYIDGTYPNSTQPVSIPAPTDGVADFITALNKYQTSKGIKPYPKIGPLTKSALLKDNLI
jgi:murein DD-endopeptidase MepM/ murein hydrolase activator NlpD